MTRRKRIAETMCWGGLSVAGVSTISVMLYSLYRLLDSVFVVGTAARTPAFVTWGMIGFALGVGSSLIGLWLLLSSRDDALAEGELAGAIHPERSTQSELARRSA